MSPHAAATTGGLSPELKPGLFIFCTAGHDPLALDYSSRAIGMFVEDEGASFILPVDAARQMGFDRSCPMRLISLRLNSELTAVGLTAAIASALAVERIPANVVAAYYHDHVFVPEAMAERALRILQGLSHRSPSWTPCGPLG